MHLLIAYIALQNHFFNEKICTCSTEQYILSMHEHLVQDTTLNPGAGPWLASSSGPSLKLWERKIGPGVRPVEKMPHKNSQKFRP